MESIKNKKVEELMHKGVITVMEEAPGKYMCEVMAEHNISCVVVQDKNGKTTGLVSDTDILMAFEKCKANCKIPDACPIKAKDVMTTDLITTIPEDDLMNAIDLLNKNKIHRLLVLAGKNPVGILGATDVANWVAKASTKDTEAFYSRFEKYEKLDETQEQTFDEIKKKKIYAVMKPGVMMVPITMGVQEVAKIFSDKHIRSVVVITDDGEMIGIVSNIDIVKAFGEEFEGRALDEMIAGDIMTQGIESIEHCMHLEEGARLMNDKHIHSLLVLFERPCEISPPPGFKRKPIVTRGIAHGVNIPVGFLSAGDIVREIAKS